MSTRFRAELLYQELDALNELQKKARKEMLREARKHRAYHVLNMCPGIGPLSVSQMMPIVVTPYRFSSKRAFWTYIGLAVVMRSLCVAHRTGSNRR
jgi:transposase